MTVSDCRKVYAHKCHFSWKSYAITATTMGYDEDGLSLFWQVFSSGWLLVDWLVVKKIRVNLISEVIIMK